MGSAQQQFSLRWNNYSNHITSALDDLRAEDELTDVTLCAEGDKIRAHKLLLSACSTFFRETFRENPCQHPVIILKGVSFVDLQAVVTFMYNGQVNVTQERLSCFLQTAEMLQIKGLTDMNDKGDNAGGDELSNKAPLLPNPRHANANSAAAKKRLSTAANAHNNSDTAQQQKPIAKRRKFIPTAQSQGGDGNSNAGNAYNSPGPSSTNAVGGTAHLNNHNNNNSNNHNSDLNNGGAGGEEAGDIDADQYPSALQDMKFKYDPDELQGSDGGGFGEGDGGYMMGDDEDDYPNDWSEDGDNSMLDYSMEQGSVDCAVGLVSSEAETGGGIEEDETEVVVQEGGGYDIIAYSDSDDPPDNHHHPMPLQVVLSPPKPTSTIPGFLKSPATTNRRPSQIASHQPPAIVDQLKSQSIGHQPPTRPSGLPVIQFSTDYLLLPSYASPANIASSSSSVVPTPPKSVTELLRASSASMPSSSTATPKTASKMIFPSINNAHTSHINILRKKRVPDPQLELVNPLDLGGSSPRFNSKPVSPFVGEPMMVHETGELMHPCLMCDKRYRLKSSLESHVKIHEGSDNTCPICGQTMSRTRDLKRHIACLHRGLLMPDGSITYPEDIDEIVPARTRRGRPRKGGDGGSDQDQGSSSNDYYGLDNTFFNLKSDSY